jgi:hypothetical protein
VDKFIKEYLDILFTIGNIVEIKFILIVTPASILELF